MIKRKHTKYYELKMRSTKIEYSTAAGVYCTEHDVRVPFCMPQLSTGKIFNHSFLVDNNKGESGIGYDMIICRDLMVQLGLTAILKCQFLQWDGATVHMKEHKGLLRQYDLTKREMCEVVMQNAEPDSTQEATEIMVKNIDSTYAKADVNQVANNVTQLNAE